jgi:DNA-directed RNA polymerase I, II, and III subunit RPABC4
MIVIALNEFFLEIVDGIAEDGHDDVYTVPVTEHESIADILKKLDASGINIETLSFKGSAMPKSVMLKSIGITHDAAVRREDSQQARFRLLSRLDIRIEDHDCDLVYRMRVPAHWKISDVYSAYLVETHREKRRKFSIKFPDSRGSSEAKELDPRLTLYECGIGNGDVLNYQVAPYEITVFENARDGGGEGTQVEVYDNWTLNDVREEYSRRIETPLMEGDGQKFLCDERQLEEEKPLWKLRIREGEQLVIERTLDAKPMVYICGECGREVELRPTDDVKCRVCFHAVVFKRRTGRICQYNCR